MKRPDKKAFRKTASWKKESLKHHLKDYCVSTSIHGVKYLAESRTRMEKCWWAAMLFCCILGNGYLISKVWIKWNDSPVIVSFAESAMPVWEIPFPAITVCSEIKAKADMFNFTNVWLKYNNRTTISDSDRTKMEEMSLLCDKHLMFNGQDLAKQSTMEFMDEIAPGIDEMTLTCQFADSPEATCSRFFKRIFTDEGFCYSFNMLSPSELFRGHGNPYFTGVNVTSNWTLEDGYSKDSPLETYPERVISAGASTAMNLVLKFHTPDADSNCRGPNRGFKVLLHNPGEYPLVTQRYMRAALNQEIIAMVQPKIMTTSNGLRSYSPSVRQCFFPSERYLEFFKIYTQRNCEVECLANFTLAYCGCVPIHFPRNKTTPLCGPGLKNCTILAETKLKLVEIHAARNSHINSKCNCLQACQSLQYDAELSQGYVDTHRTFEALGDNVSELAGFEISTVKVFFKDMQFTTRRRSELFGPVDFLANCGGLLGLFCGISLLSICELVYYITIRFWTNLREVKKKHESMDKGDEIDIGLGISRVDE